MSKITGKKKSCFEITSVTPAQVGGSVTGDGSERLDDPQDLVDAGTLSEDTLNNAGENQEGQLPITSPDNGGSSIKSTSSGRNIPHNAGGSVPFVPSSNIVTSATAVITSMSHTAPSNSCSSRFRVIKLDHSNGEPFRRGRWTCTEFYVKESDSGVHRTVDSLKSSPSIDHNLDSGLGATCNSVVNSSAFHAQALENSTDSGYSVSTGHHTHSQAPESLQQGYGLSPQIGSGASAFQPTGYAAAASQQSKQAQVNMSPGTPQTFIPDSLSGVHHGASIPPASHPQQFVYSPHPSQLQFGSSAQNHPITSSMGSTSQVSSPQFTLAGPGTQGLGGDVVSTPGFMQQVGNASVMAPVISGSTQQQPSGGASSASATTSSIHSGGQNVPATVPSATSVLPGVSNQAPGVAGLIQLQGAYGGVVNPAEDGWQMPEALPQQSVGARAVKDCVTSPIGEGLSLSSPAVNSFFGIQITMNADGDGASGASVVAIDNKIEQAMDLVKSHLMYAVREEVEVLKEQIKELYERNSVLERENAVLKSLANTQQLSQLSSQLSCLSSPQLQLHQPPFIKNSTHSLVHHEGSQGVSYQPNITSA
ncbi:TSC22 domain family protein 2 [Anableps anableps]